MRQPRGVTLLEMMVALGISAVAITAALVLAQSQQRTFYVGAKGRQAQMSARSALLFLEQKVPLAGFGVDPSIALDFQWYGCAGGPSTCPRDRTDAPDELVFYSRNPAYRVVEGTSTTATSFAGRAWKGVAVESNVLKLEARNGETFPQGQIYQVTCAQELRFTYVTVSKTIVATADGELDLPIDPVAPGTLATGVAADPFRRQDVADQANADFKKWNACLASDPRVFQIDRFRFYVRTVDVGGGKIDPYLVLDQGIDSDADGDIDEDDELLVAEGIENFQVGYVFADSTIPMAGATSGTAINVPDPGAAAGTAQDVITPTFFPGTYDAAKAFPLLHSSQYFVRSSQPLEPARKTNDQGNIRAIRIALVSRSADPDVTGTANLSYGAGSQLWVLNFDTLPSWITDYITASNNVDRYLRAVVSTTLEVPNLASRGLLPN